MAITATKRLAGKEDINWDVNNGNEETSFYDSLGVLRKSTKINTAHVPADPATKAAFGGAVTLDGVLSKIKEDLAAAGAVAALDQDTIVSFVAGSNESEKQALIDSQVKNLGGHTLTFEFPAGINLTHSDRLVFAGFANGTLVIDGQDILVQDGAAITSSLFLVSDCLCKVKFQDIQIKHTLSDYGIEAVRCQDVSCDGVAFTGQGSSSFSVFYNLANGKLENCLHTTDSAVKVSGEVFDLLSSMIPGDGDDIVALTGVAVNASPYKVYDWTVSGACTLNASGWPATGFAVSIMRIAVQSGGRVTGGGVTLVDTLVENKVNFCVLRSFNGVVQLFVTDTL